METVIGTILKDPPKEGQGAQWALTVAVLLLAALIGWLIRKLDKNSKEDAARAAEFREIQEKHAAETAKRFDEHRKEVDQRFAEQDDRMACIEKDYTKTDRHYQDMGGWRTEIVETRAELRDGMKAMRMEISNLYGQLLKTVMEGMRNGVKG